MSEITIALDAGHGGSDPGATYRGRQEKDDTLRLVQAVGKILEDNGVNVVYTRTNDIYETPFKKATDANNAGADYFVSIHRNSSERANQYSGVETLVYNEAGIKAEMAQNVNKELEAAGFTNLGITERPNLVVLKRTQMPAILIEVGFINNDKDNATLDNNFNRVAEAIADGILMTVLPQDASGSRITSIDDSPTPIDTIDSSLPTNSISSESSAVPSPKDMVQANGTFYVETETGNPSDEAENEDDYPDIDRYYNTNNNQIDSGTISDDFENNPYSSDYTVMPESNNNQNNIPMYNRRNNMAMPNTTPAPQNEFRNNMPNQNIQYNTRYDIPPRSDQNQDNGEPLYRVQVGAYRNKDNADRMLNSLLIEGFPAFIIYEDGLYKVQVGAFRYLSNAVKMERRLRRFRYNTYIVYS